MDSVKGPFDGGIVSAWEESIWLDRRESACRQARAKGGAVGTFFAGLRSWLKRTRVRMQLGPVCGGMAGGDPDKPF